MKKKKLKSVILKNCYLTLLVAELIMSKAFLQWHEQQKIKSFCPVQNKATITKCP